MRRTLAKLRWGALLLCPALLAPVCLAKPLTFTQEIFHAKSQVLTSYEKFQVLKNKTHRNPGWINTVGEEVPLSGINHRFGVMVPLMHVPTGGGATGLGDMMLTYRYRLLNGKSFAMSPRFMAQLPTGDATHGLGSGGTGGRLLLPLVVRLSDEFLSIVRAGVTYIPDGRTPRGAAFSNTVYKYSARLIYMPRDNWQWQVELGGTSGYRALAGKPVVEKTTIFLKPGVRCRFAVSDTTSVTPGISVPIGIGPSGGDWSALAYFIVEQRQRAR